MHSKRAFALCTILSFGMGSAGAAEFKVNDDTTLNAGFGVRASFSRTDAAAPDGVSKSTDFSVESVRLFLSGSYGKWIKGTFNTERGSDGSIKMLDGIAQLEPSPYFNLWLGRMLPPSDRANLYGPYFAVPWSFPGTVSAYPAIFAGRDNGALLWGRPLDGKLLYAFGAYEGHNKVLGLSGQSDKPLYAGRIAYSFLDAEPAPAHYTGGWYGGKDLLTIGVAGQSQKDGVGTATAAGKFSAWNADLLFEKNLGSAGVPNFEAAYYKYKLDAVDCGSGEPGAPACLTGENVGGLVDGKATLVGASWLFAQKVGEGQFMPYVRYQRFNRTLSSTTAKTTDVGVNYILRGPNARISFQYSKMKDDRNAAPRNDIGTWLLGAQLMF